MHGAILNDGGADMGRSPGAQHGGCQGEEYPDDKQRDGCGVEAEPMVASGPPGQEQPGGTARIEMEEAVPRCGEAEDVDDPVDEVSETKLQGCGFHFGL